MDLELDEKRHAGGLLHLIGGLIGAALFAAGLYLVFFQAIPCMRTILESENVSGATLVNCLLLTIETPLLTYAGLMMLINAMAVIALFGSSCKSPEISNRSQGMSVKNVGQQSPRQDS